MTGLTLTSTAILFLVLLALPHFVGLTVVLTRPRRRRFVGALAGGVAFALGHIAWDRLASYTGWWQFTIGRHAPLYFYLGSFAWGACSALLGRRVQRRFGQHGLGIYLVGLGVLGKANDHLGMATL
jgi:hypothetical protein